MSAAVEDQADLDGMFDVDEFAENALYRPPAGPDVPVVILVDRGRERQAFGAYEGRGPFRRVFLRETQVAVVKVDAKIIMLDAALQETGERMTVQDEPDKDESGKVWILDVVLDPPPTP